jgi:hypothetical protein
VADEGAPDGAQDRRLPELKYLKDAGGHKNGNCYEAGRQSGPDEKSQEDPERDIQDSASLVTDPELQGPYVELRSDAEGGDNCEKLEEKAAKRLNRRHHEKDRSACR